MTAPSRARLGPARLVVRQVAAAPAATLAVAAIVLVSSLAAALAPRALDRVFTDELRYGVSSVAATQRDLIGTTIGAPPTGFEAQLDALRADMGDVLRASAGAAGFVSRTPALGAIADAPLPDAPITLLSVAIDPAVADRITVVEGAAPEPVTPLESGGFEPISFVLSTESADAMRWSVGEVRTVRATGGASQQFVLSGIVEAVDPDSDYWSVTTSVLQPELFDDGNSTPTVTATGFVNPSATAAAWAVMGSLSTTAWFSLDPAGLSFTQSTALLQDLRQFTSSTHDIAGDGQEGELSFLSFSTGLLPALERAEGRAASTVAVLSMAIAGPLGVVLAVIALGSRAILERRRSGITLASARGASPAQLRGALALEGLLAGVPAAALGMLGAALLLPAPVGVEATVVPVALALAPAVLLAARAPARGLRIERADLEPGRGSRARLLGEAVVVGLAVAAVIVVLQRGVASGGPALDPLIAATPLLLALAVCVVVLRVAPYPLQALAGALRTRAGLTGFLGATRAVRDPAASVAPVLALVVGVSVAVFSGVLVSTIDSGVSSAARGVVGADLQVRGPVFDETRLEAIASLPGVAAISGVDDAGPAVLAFGGDRRTVTVLVTDLAGLRELRGESAVPAGAENGSAEPVPAIVSADLALEIGDQQPSLEGDALEVVAVGSPDDGVGIPTNWVMIDASASLSVMGVEFRPRTVLIGLDPGADSADVASAVSEQSGPGVLSSDPASVAEALRASPAVSGLGSALVTALILAAVLAAIAVVMTAVVGARSRTRMLALLATLGLPPRGSRALVAWELAPVGLGAVIAGTALGLALPWIVLGGVDLRPFTGGSRQPTIVIDPGLVLLLVGGFAALAAVAVLVAASVGRRTSTAAALRMGDE
ncbi:FtsX-like permease family protein [Salinibacterium soli]|uniref:ABC3 transporter permease C-terminal domain-containing protein n=1 Tax=Antiquaquibacter soli TaxID=3064523 RepID=A0ABT9BMH1_9MICO|nr:FtsX-like permease family protein [Protaetiibacter sp. WY-16]MDO7882229.1 hypothetical protein [Protaetiibacter sp. WY-16]